MIKYYLVSPTGYEYWFVAGIPGYQKYVEVSNKDGYREMITIYEARIAWEQLIAYDFRFVKTEKLPV